MEATIQEWLGESAALFGRVREETTRAIQTAGQALVVCLTRGGKVLVAGNGGSASQAQHLATELAGRFLLSERRPLPCVALCADTAILTALGNDFGYEAVFSRQILALAKPGDTAVFLSTSGSSRNVVAAASTARTCGLCVIGLTGEGGGALRQCCDILVAVPSTFTPHIQEAHLAILHIWCQMVDTAFGGDRP
ncbi:MAG: SIS domain-containing protein [Candidatus Schekmanbacteria bacterium]|nr:SIS domain-containing protein [Candidatus Schekmanbacteria bacterium]